MNARRHVAVIAAALLAGSLLCAGARAADDPASALLAKHAAYVGWRGGDGSIKTLRETGEITRDGKVLRELTSISVPVRRACR
jgi:hypothetical protein